MLTKQDKEEKLKGLRARVKVTQEMIDSIEDTPVFEDSLQGQISDAKKKAKTKINSITDKLSKETGMTFTAELKILNNRPYEPNEKDKGIFGDLGIKHPLYHIDPTPFTLEGCKYQSDAIDKLITFCCNHGEWESPLTMKLWIINTINRRC